MVVNENVDDMVDDRSKKCENIGRTALESLQDKKFDENVNFVGLDGNRSHSEVLP